MVDLKNFARFSLPCLKYSKVRDHRTLQWGMKKPMVPYLNHRLSCRKTKAYDFTLWYIYLVDNCYPYLFFALEGKKKFIFSKRSCPKVIYHWIHTFCMIFPLFGMKRVKKTVTFYLISPNILLKCQSAKRNNYDYWTKISKDK